MNNASEYGPKLMIEIICFHFQMEPLMELFFYAYRIFK